MTTDDADNGWDSLAQEFGLDAPAPSPRADKPETAKSPARLPAPRPARDPRPEVEGETDDFGAGVTDEPSQREAFYDPGPGAVADDIEEFDDSAPELLEDEIEDTSSAEDSTEGEPGKRRRRRRRRKKKGGPGEPEKDAADVAEAPSELEGEIVEEGEAPAEVEDDEEEPAPSTAVDEEMEAEAAGPRPEWHVMTWMELVSKLYRPS